MSFKTFTKSKNFRIILFSVIGIAVLAAVILILSLTAPKDEDGEEDSATEETDDPALVLQPEENGEITSIQVENSHGSYAVKKQALEDESEIWVIDGVEIDTDLLDQTSIEALASALTDMTARSLVEENASDLAQYGLDEPQATVKATYENGNSFTLIIGDVVTSGSANYILVDDNPNVYSYYTTYISSFIDNTEMNLVQTTVMPSYDSNSAPVISKLTITRKDLEKPIIVEAFPEADEESDSIRVYTHTFTSPYNIYLNLDTGSELLYAMFELTADKAAFLEVNDETKAAAGIDDPFCEVDMLMEDVIYRLYIGDPIYDENGDVTAYYGLCNKVPDIIYVFSVSSLIWVTMDSDDYLSNLFLVPYIYDITDIKYKDTSCEFTITVTGTNEDNAFYIDGEEADAQQCKEFYQFLIGCRGETLYTDEQRGDLIAEFSYFYEDDRGTDTVSLYNSDEDRTVIIAVNGENIFKTKWNYQTRLLENAQALLNGEEINQYY